MKKILLIGCGHMGNALLVSWLKSNKYAITVIDPKKYKVIKNKYKSKYIKSFKNISDINTITNFDFIILL